ncbi:hypothetical protein [Actinomycetospora sp. NBRC 106378]|uniref:hypothetical protein n=1 Tax=Actinomycetospora sp. NBRC 106378 TaxID=3032208 RepID=UPI0024A20E51|nr:hypothetical protein [Actinomycetospora sp. NBRC 106378]GLZ53602.1 hypothetical protein Acsp07_32190 [Actinomycetospora sp. NBRC 106378]
MTVLQPKRHAQPVQSQRSTAARRSWRMSSAPQPAVGHLVVDASHSALTPFLATYPVTVLVDDLPVSIRWGRTDIALPPGRHRVEIAVDRGDGWGRVVEAVPVAAGHTVDVFYRAPVLPGAGALGPVPQSTRGVVALLAGLVLLLALLGVGVWSLLALVG